MDLTAEQFALDAELLISEGMTDEAFKICQRGLEEFPEYPSAYISFAKANELKGNFEDAVALIDKAIELFPFASYLNKKKENLVELISLKVLADAEIEDVHDIPFLRFVQNLDGESYEHNELSSSNIRLVPGIEFTALHIRKKNQSVSHIRPLNPLPPFSFETSYQPPKPEVAFDEEDEIKPIRTKSGSKSSHEVKSKEDVPLLIVTETIARILVGQGAYDAAVKAYKELMKNDPAKEDYFKEKISEINLLMKK